MCTLIEMRGNIATNMIATTVPFDLWGKGKKGELKLSPEVLGTPIPNAKMESPSLKYNPDGATTDFDEVDDNSDVEEANEEEV